MLALHYRPYRTEDFHCPRGLNRKPHANQTHVFGPTSHAREVPPPTSIAPTMPANTGQRDQPNREQRPDLPHRHAENGASERRVAQMAAAGMTNRDIAQALF